MSKIISVVPNISEGNDTAIIEQFSETLRRVPDLILLDVSRDQARNRTVFSFTGSKEAIFAGGIELYRGALEKIDMSLHQGQYPRIGAVDVFPFVPLKNASIEEAVEWSVEFAEKVAREFQLPVFLFSESARYPARRDIDNIREGEYEGLAEKMKDPRWKPDLGPDSFLPRFGATIIGARYPLMSFNVHFDSGDMEAVRSIDNALNSIRHIRAHPGRNPSDQLAQITVVISNYRMTPMYRVIENIRLEAGRYGVGIRNVEMIGLIPEIALIDSALHYLGIREFDLDHLLEKKIQSRLNEKINLE